jgi:DNA-binding transcriptional LysR family regulator
LLLERGAALLADEAALRREIQQLAGLEAGELVVGAGPFSAEISVGRAMTRLLAKHPQLRARIACFDPDQIVRDVLAGRCDLGVADPGAASRESQLHHEALPFHPIHLFARPDHPLAARAGLRLADVLAFPVVGSRVRGATTTRLPAEDPLARRSGHNFRRPSMRTRSTWPVASRRPLRSFPRCRLVAADLRDGSLVQLDFHEPWMQTTYGVFWRSDRTPSPAVRAFVDELRAVESEISAQSLEPDAGVAASISGPPRPARQPARA